MKNILVHADADDARPSRLAAAFDLARATKGHLSLCQSLAMPPILSGDVHGGILPVQPLMERAQAEAAADRAALEPQLQAEGRPYDWVSDFGDASGQLTSRARLADIIILSLSEGGKGPAESVALASDVLLHARAPLLAVPPALQTFHVRGHAVIAWNGSHECANALRAATPLLALATHVMLLQIDDNSFEAWPVDAACRYLYRHGIKVDVLQRGMTDSVHKSLLSAACELAADYLVMGGYGHWRVTEWLLGGVTRAMLREASLPLLLAH